MYACMHSYACICVDVCVVCVYYVQVAVYFCMFFVVVCMCIVCRPIICPWAVIPACSYFHAIEFDVSACVPVQACVCLFSCVCLFAYPMNATSIRPPVSPSVRPFCCLSISPLVRLSVRPIVLPFVCVIPVVPHSRSLPRHNRYPCLAFQRTSPLLVGRWS